MKAFKKHIFLFILILIGTYFCGATSVNAGNINWAGVKTECIYDDGGAYSSAYIGEGDYYRTVTNRITYNLVGVDTTQSGTTSSVVYVTKPINSYLSGSAPKCKTYLRIGIVNEEDEDGNNNPTSYFKFDNDSSDTKFEEDDFDGAGWWDSFWTGAKTAEDKADEANDTAEKYELVAERYIITEKAGDPNYTLTYREKSEQATGSDNYAYIMVYDNAYILKTKEKTTLLTTGTGHFSGISVTEDGKVIGIEDEDTICINNPEPFSTTDSTGVASYYFRNGQIRYEVGTCGGEYDREYVLFNTGLGTGDAPSDELCDSIMPETSKVLKKVIGIAQLLVPVLMIVLCGIDIGKIVVSGNIEEDLPKQKKKIIARMVVGVSFFFLPLVVMLTIDLLKESGAVEAEDVQSIECLFE